MIPWRLLLVHAEDHPIAGASVREGEFEKNQLACHWDLDCVPTALARAASSLVIVRFITEIEPALWISDFLGGELFKQLLGDLCLVVLPNSFPWRSFPSGSPSPHSQPNFFAFCRVCDKGHERRSRSRLSLRGARLLSRMTYVKSADAVRGLKSSVKGVAAQYSRAVRAATRSRCFEVPRHKSDVFGALGAGAQKLRPNTTRSGNPRYPVMPEGVKPKWHCGSCGSMYLTQGCGQQKSHQEVAFPWLLSAPAAPLARLALRIFPRALVEAAPIVRGGSCWLRRKTGRTAQRSRSWAEMDFGLFFGVAWSSWRHPVCCSDTHRLVV